MAARASARLLTAREVGEPEGEAGGNAGCKQDSLAGRSRKRQ